MIWDVEKEPAEGTAVNETVEVRVHRECLCSKEALEQIST